ncbi:MAG: hypothetical protein ACPGUZ_01315 [Holosporaceae bacterium]
MQYTLLSFLLWLTFSDHLFSASSFQQTADQLMRQVENAINEHEQSRLQAEQKRDKDSMIVHEAGKITGEQLKKELSSCTTGPDNKYAKKETCVAVFKKTRRFLGVDPSKSLSKNLGRQLRKGASKGKKKGKRAGQKMRGWFSSSYKKKTKQKAADTKTREDQWKQKRDAGLKSHPQDARKTEQPLPQSTTGSASSIPPAAPPPPPGGMPPPPPPTAPPPPLSGAGQAKTTGAGGLAAELGNVQLKKAPSDSAPAKTNPRDDLMKEIQSGSAELKKVDQDQQKPPPEKPEGLAGMMAQAMDDRRPSVALSDSETDRSDWSDSDDESDAKDTGRKSDSGISSGDANMDPKQRSTHYTTQRRKERAQELKKPPLPPKPQEKPKPVKAADDDLPPPPDWL